jgi:hypothetical protein
MNKSKDGILMVGESLKHSVGFETDRDSINLFVIPVSVRSVRPFIRTHERCSFHYRK